MPLRLKALYADVVLPLTDTLVLGRSRQCEISATTVSRHACTVTQADACASLTAAKTVYVQSRSSTAIEVVQKGGTCQVSSNRASHFVIASCSCILAETHVDTAA